MSPRKDKPLPLVDRVTERDSVMHLTIAPALKGSNPGHNLVCGSCAEVLLEGFSEEDAAARFTAPHQLLIRCPRCGEHCSVPARIGF